MKDIADRLNKEPIVIKTQDKVTTAYFIGVETEFYTLSFALYRSPAECLLDSLI